MREFRLAFAACDDSGIVRPDIADKLGKRIAEAYGGYTRLEGFGGYIMHDGTLVQESVYVFDIATDVDAESVTAFATMAAQEIKRAMNQESVYFRDTRGEVHLL